MASICGVVGKYSITAMFNPIRRWALRSSRFKAARRELRAAVRRLWWAEYCRLSARTPWRRYGIWLACLAVVASTVFGAGFLAWDAYGQTVARYQQGANILGIVLAEQTTRYVQVTDRVLQELQRRVGTLNIHGVEDFQARVGTLETHNLLRDSMQNLPPGNAFLLIDAQGHIASSSRSLAEKGEDLSDVDYFRHLMATDDAKVTVSRTRMGKITGKPTIFVARRINTSDGDFLGVAVAAIDVLDLSRFHHAINKLPGQALTLLRRDGSVLTRDPDPLQFAGSGMPAESPWHNLVQAGGGTYRSPGFLGGGASDRVGVSAFRLSAGGRRINPGI